MESYKGKEKYIFVSYAHKDDATVLPIIEKMQEEGFRIWFDKGIEAGTEYNENIAEHLESSSAVIAFMSDNYIMSEYCKDELYFAIESDKNVLVVYLHKTELTPGLKMKLGRRQSLFKYRHKSEETFLHELMEAEMFKPCKAAAKNQRKTLAEIEAELRKKILAEMQAEEEAKKKAEEEARSARKAPPTTAKRAITPRAEGAACKYEAFIGYRRNGGDVMARLIHHSLRSNGHNTYLDLDNVCHGNFDLQLYSAIEESKNYLLILSPGALNRCINEGDWLRLEIRHALECGKNVIPVIMRGFSFPKDLPEDIAEISHCKAVHFSSEFFDISIKAIIDRL